MSSKLLEQAIVDAQALRDSAFKSAQATLLEKFAPQVKEAVEKLLEQEEEPGAETPAPSDALAGGDSAAPLTDFGGAPPDESNKGYVSGKAKDVPLAATDGEKLCPCPDDEEDVTLELNLADLADQLKIGKEAEEDEETSQQPNLAGMQNQPPAAGGAAAPIAESLELENIELEEEVLEMDEGEGDGAAEMVAGDKNYGIDGAGSVAEELTEVSLDELLSEAEDEEAEDEEDEDEESDENDEDNKKQLDEEVLEEYEQIRMVQMGPDGRLHIYLINDEGEREDLGLAPPDSYEGQELEGGFYSSGDDYGSYGGYGRSRYGGSRYGRRRFEEEAKKDKKKLTPSQQKLAAMREPKDKVTYGDVVAARIASGEKSKDKKKTNESSVKQLMSTSAQLLKEHQNTVKLVEKKDSQIQKLLEENKKFTSIIEEMSDAFKKLEEVNVLNATLFYSNQVLKSASLNERQKTHIVEAISKADSVNEAKAVYETLINSMGGPAEKERSPKSLNEAINKQSSFRLPHKQAEQPADPGKDRWLKLAGIK